MATLYQRLHRKNADGSYDVVHLETSAKLVKRADGVTSVEDSLTEIESWDLLKYEEAGDYDGMPYITEDADAATLEGHRASDFAAASHKHTKSEITDFAHTHEISDINSLQDQLAGKAPAYSYGTEDLTAGTSTLETGKLYFVYE